MLGCPQPQRAPPFCPPRSPSHPPSPFKGPKCLVGVAAGAVPGRPWWFTPPNSVLPPTASAPNQFADALQLLPSLPMHCCHGCIDGRVRVSREVGNVVTSGWKSSRDTRYKMAITKRLDSRWADRSRCKSKWLVESGMQWPVVQRTPGTNERYRGVSPTKRSSKQVCCGLHPRVNQMLTRPLTKWDKNAGMCFFLKKCLFWG